MQDIISGNIYNVQEIYIGNVIPNDAIYYELRVKDKYNTIIGSYYNLSPFNDNYTNNAVHGINNDIYLVTRYLNYNIKYLININYYYELNGEIHADNSSILFLPQEAIIENGVVTYTPSGDLFTPQVNANQIIDNQNQIFDNFQDWYSNAMTITSGDVIEILNEVKNTLEIPGVEISGELAIIEFLSGDYSDFKITWENYSPNFTIKGQAVNAPSNFIPKGEVNFSKMERENPSLHTAMTWVRTITTFGIISILLHQAWIILMKMLGVGVEIYGDKQEEKAQLAKQQEATAKKTMSQLEYINRIKLREYEKLARRKGWK